MVQNTLKIYSFFGGEVHKMWDAELCQKYEESSGITINYESTGLYDNPVPLATQAS